MTSESEKFQQYSRDDWWSPKGRLFSLHRINPLRFSYFAEKCGGRSALKGKSVVDVGCGGGLLSEEFAKAGARVTGIDLSEAAIAAAEKHAGETGLEIDYRKTSPAELAENEAEKFDIAVCAEVLEHVDDVEGFVSDALRLIKPGGLFLFGTINKTVRARLLAIFVAEDVLGMVPPGTHDYSRFVRPSELARILSRHGAEMTDVRGMSFDPLRFDFKLTRDTSVNYLGAARKEG